MVYMQKAQKLEEYRHSLAHLLGAALVDLYPGVKLTIGPAVDDGFYYDADIPVSITESDLSKIEKRMKEIIKNWDTPSEKEVTKEEALAYYKDNEFKKELIEDIVSKGEKLILVTFGDFVDLCRGGHIATMKDVDVNSFTLSSLAASYWRGDEKRPSLTRIYGYAFFTQKELEEYKEMREEMKKRDHRLLGSQLDIFAFSEEIGPGLPMWLPNGRTLQILLEKWSMQAEKERGYQQVATPLITKGNLFYTSTHLPHYEDSMYCPMEIEGEKYYIKPMNCPMHHELFKSRPHSYKELPIRLSEYGFCHRYEDSGALFGLMRVRGMKMNDAHIYCSKDQVVEEFVEVIKLHQYYYDLLNIDEYWMELALRNPDSDKYHGSDEMWEEAERLTKEAMEIAGVPYKIAHDGAAFYGPKVDFQVKSSIGREFTASTNQIDLFMPERFKLEFTNAQGEKEIPAVIHRAPLGTHERFIGFLIEHFAGRFPFWLAPEQVRIVSVSDNVSSYIKEIESILQSTILDTPIKYNEIRYTTDTSSHSIGKKIKEALLKKIPCIIVVGEKDQKENVVSIRNYEKQETIPLAKLQAYIKNL